MKKIIGVYGLSGSGKTTFSKRLSELSCEVIDADLIAREVLHKGSPLLFKVSEAFGADVILKDGSLDRKKLGEIVFSDRKKLEKLNGITWSEIDRIIKARALSSKAETVVIDCPMLHLVSSKDICDELVLIKADIKELSDRLVKREGITKELAEKRLKLQLEDMNKVSTRVIENTGNIDEFITKADSFYNELKG